jgi:hypothetical protein
MSLRVGRIVAALCVLAILAGAADLAYRHWPSGASANPKSAILNPGLRPSGPQSEAPPADQFPFVALDGSGVYHTRECGYTNRAAESRKRYFPTTAAAEQPGLRPCRYCLGGNP